MWMRFVTDSSELQSEWPMKCLPMPDEKLSIVLKRFVSLMLSILRSAEHIRNFVRSSVWKCIDLSNALHAWRYMFYFIVMQGLHFLNLYIRHEKASIGTSTINSTFFKDSLMLPCDLSLPAKAHELINITFLSPSDTC